MPPYHVLNTRPAHQSESLTQLIKAKGSLVYHLPVFEIQPIQINAENIGEYDYIIFLSANAVVNYFNQKENKHAHVIAIGPATKLALEKMHIKDVMLPVDFSSDGILSMPEMQAVNNKKIAIISGEKSKSILPDTLKKRGAEVRSIICYRRNAIKYDMAVTFKKLKEFNVDYIISTSMESYLALLALFDRSEYRTWLLKKTICVISDEMRRRVIADGFLNVIQAKNATDEAIVLSLGF